MSNRHKLFKISSDFEKDLVGCCFFFFILNDIYSKLLYIMKSEIKVKHCKWNKYLQRLEEECYEIRPKFLLSVTMNIFKYLLFLLFSERKRKTSKSQYFSPNLHSQLHFPVSSFLEEAQIVRKQLSYSYRKCQQEQQFQPGCPVYRDQQFT